MDWRDLPPLAAMRALAAFRDEGGVSEAGAALGVSPAAISQQLRSLEAHLGVSLFDRSGRAMVLTTEGVTVAQAAVQGLAQMIAASREVTGANDARPLHISATPTFAAAWLMPRLAKFRASRQKYRSKQCFYQPFGWIERAITLTTCTAF